MTETAPFTKDDLEAPYPARNAAAFFGYDEYADGNPARGPDVYTYNHGNIITLDGSSGPWFVRQLLGPYAGVLQVHWNDSSITQDAELLGEMLNLTVERSNNPLNRSELQDGFDVDEIFSCEPGQHTIQQEARLTPANV